MKTSFVRSFSQALVIVMLPVVPVGAATQTWTGAVSANWATAGNWSSALPVAGDTLVFTGATGVGGLTLNNNTAIANIDDLVFNPGASAYTLTGNAITLGSSSPTIVNRSAVGQAINFNLNLATAPTISGFQGVSLGGVATLNGVTYTNTLSGARALTFGGGVNLSPDATAKTATFAGSGVTRITSVIANSATGGAAASNLTYNGSGSLELAAANTFSGLTRLSNGTLTVSHASALQNSRLQLDGQSSGFPVLNLLSNSDATFAVTGTNTFNGAGVAVINVDPLTSGNAKTITLANLSSNGAGQLNVTSSNDYTLGVTTFTAAANTLLNPTTGTLAIGTINVTGGVFLAGDTAGNTVGAITSTATSGQVSLTKVGTGTWTLTGASTYIGDTAVFAGTLIHDMSQGASLNSATRLSMSGGTFILKGAATGTSSQSLGIPSGFGFFMNTGRAGHNSIQVDANNGDGTVLTLNNAVFRGTPGTVDFVLPTGAQTATNGIVAAGFSIRNGLLGATASTATYATVNGGTDWAARNGSNNIVAYSSYTDIAALGATIANGSTTNVRINSTGTTGDLALGAATTQINTLFQNSTTTAATVDTTGKTLKLDGILLAPTSAALTIGTAVDAGTLTFSGASDMVFFNNSTSALTINSTITGAVQLTKSGAGLLVLGSSANTYTGRTTFNGGTIRISADTSLGTAPVSATTTQILMNGGTLQLAAAFDLATTRGITIAENGGTLDTQAFNSTYAGVIGGSVFGAAFTKSGAGTLTLSGANTYIGTTTVSGGTLAYGASNVISTGDVTVTGASSVLDLGASRTDSVGVITVADGGSITGSGTSALTSTRGFELKSGSVGVILASGSANVTATKSTTGTVTLSGANTYAGQTFVNAGTLLVNGTHTGAGHYTVAAGAKLGGSGSITLATGNTVSIAGTLAAGNSPGTLDITGNLVFQDGATLEVELGGASPGEGAGFYDQVNMTLSSGAVSIEDNVALSLTTFGGFMPAASDLFFVLTRADADTNTYTTLFNGTTEAGLVSIAGGYVGQITYLADWNGTQGSSTLTGGNDIAIYNITSTIPEPSSYALLGAVAAGLVVFFNRRRT